jgi:hypothetical protein
MRYRMFKNGANEPLFPPLSIPVTTTVYAGTLTLITPVSFVAGETLAIEVAEQGVVTTRPRAIRATFF